MGNANPWHGLQFHSTPETPHEMTYADNLYITICDEQETGMGHDVCIPINDDVLTPPNTPFGMGYADDVRITIDQDLLSSPNTPIRISQHKNKRQHKMVLRSSISRTRSGRRYTR
jgi:hypothetical protein